MKTHARSPLKLDRGLVVGVDERGLSDHAVAMADELGRRLGAPVHRVHAVPTPPDVWPGLDPARGEALTVELLAAASDSVNSRVRALLSGPSASTRPADQASAGTLTASPPLVEPAVKIVPGPPAAVLLEEVRARKASMIVIGAHRKREPLDFGNTVRAVFAKSTVPVWVQPLAPRPIRRILAAVDLSEETPFVLAAACALARAFGAEVKVVHCFHVNGLQLASGLDSAGYALTFPIEEVRRTERVRFEREIAGFDWQDVAHAEMFIEGDATATLLARAADADLVVLGTHGRTGLTSVVLGGVAYSVLKRSVKPILAVQKPGRKFRL